jgi:hypothetical protein
MADNRKAVKPKIKKKVRQGKSTHTKYGSKGGGVDGSTPSKLYKKRSRGQGK